MRYLARRPRREVARQRPAQIAAAGLDRLEAGALHDGLEAPAHRFDLRKLRHAMDIHDGDGDAGLLTIKAERRPRHIELLVGSRYGLVAPGRSPKSRT